MTWGIVKSVSTEGAIVDIGESEGRSKPMKVPKGMSAAVGDGALVEKVSGVYIVVQIYGGV